ncbi:hypothetical protein RUM43_006863 [Polyplax serrata]|uniref:Uncharacterized protein n=1 Tax=Polyplax serrata TaxID=468196 RepID=A0AAN8SA28_POLSC
MGCHCNVPDVVCTQHPDAPKQRVFPNNETNPPYLPQPSDEFASATLKDDTSGANLGPWATGRVTWSNTAGLIGEDRIISREVGESWVTTSWFACRSASDSRPVQYNTVQSERLEEK